MPQIIISGPTYGQPQPVRVRNGSGTRALPVNTEIAVSAEELADLELTDHSIQILDGDTAADEAPAPAGSGDGGEAGAGGSGEPGAAASGQEAELPPNFLDRSITKIIADLPGLDLAQIKAAKAAEESGGTRKTLIAALNEAIAAKEAPAA